MLIGPQEIIDRLEEAERLQLFLDYDGTLAEFAPTPDDILPDPEVIEILTGLRDHPDIWVAVVSGRRLDHIRALLPIPGILLTGTYGIEALTPLPQGDVTLDEMAEAMGDKILLDGIPAVFFMPQYSVEELMSAVERVVALFHPRLVLGISDELPEGTDETALERVELVSRWCREHGG